MKMVSNFIHPQSFLQHFIVVLQTVQTVIFFNSFRIVRGVLFCCT